MRTARGCWALWPDSKGNSHLVSQSQCWCREGALYIVLNQLRPPSELWEQVGRERRAPGSGGEAWLGKGMRSNFGPLPLLIPTSPSSFGGPLPRYYLP